MAEELNQCEPLFEPVNMNSCRPSQTCRRKPPSDAHPRRHVIGGGENRRPAEALRVSGSTGGDGCI